ncbi:PREDICTED: uncharacterized protein LOC108777034 isoform X2 [Cyphomyrmex costatus]|uniref:uncharacterized protein LOC108777034 isoform X2 n=1 Tax=Cyphomyrmex costatus TaxID=456900 RepID=UPI0008522F55|nr:PREDICTED: uncharacterized protein LOC108777034 isoform X2 [Cyphomyrmex costatus]
MKSFLLYACFLIIAPSNLIEVKKFKHVIETLHDDIEACMIENNVTETDNYNLEDFANDVHTQPENEERTRRLGCWVACVLKRQNLMEDSNIKEPQIHVRINLEYGDIPDEAIIHEIARKCMKQVRNVTQECKKSISLIACGAKAVYEEQRHRQLEIEEAEGKAEVEQTV